MEGNYGAAGEGAEGDGGTEEQAQEQVAAVRKTSVEARAVLKALVGEQGVSREPFTEERSVWRRMKALGNSGSDHSHTRN
jgi:hypothetical protein